MNKFRNTVFAIAFAVSLVVLALATISGKDSRIEIFIGALGTLGQMWIAVLLYLLSREQFRFTKASADQEHRTANYDRRVELQRNFSSACKGIGFTALSEENVQKLRAHIRAIDDLFGVDAKLLADETYQAALSAKRIAQQLGHDSKAMQGDPEYRACIETFREKQRDIYLLMRDRTGVEVPAAEG
jgi:hypothetical protein